MTAILLFASTLLFLSAAPGSHAVGEQGMRYRLVEVASGLRWPTSMARLPDGRLLVTERAGRLLLIEGARTQVVSDTPATVTGASAGYIDVAVAPDVAGDALVYLSHASAIDGGSALQVSRGRLGNGRFTQRQVVLQVLPPQQARHNYGGRMLLIGDQLLVGSGDRIDSRLLSQFPDSELGKMLRVTGAGEPHHDNPFQHPDALRVLSLGLRNPAGIASGGRKAPIFFLDQGPNGGDELNRLHRGSNYGWPAVTHGVDLSGAQVSPFRAMPEMQAPLWVWKRPIRPSGIAWYSGREFPQWRGSLLITALRSRGVHRLSIHGDQVVDEEWLLQELAAPLSDIRVFADGSIHLLTHEARGRLLRLQARR